MATRWLRRGAPLGCRLGAILASAISLREPLEEGAVTISRAGTAATYPARFTLVAATNPCPCGMAGDPERECRCLPEAIDRYRGRVSGPLLDRIDLRVHVPRVAYAELRASAAARETSATVRERVREARERMCARLAGTGRRANAELTVAEVRRAHGRPAPSWHPGTGALLPTW